MSILNLEKIIIYSAARSVSRITLSWFLWVVKYKLVFFFKILFKERFDKQLRYPCGTSKFTTVLTTSRIREWRVTSSIHLHTFSAFPAEQFILYVLHTEKVYVFWYIINDKICILIINVILKYVLWIILK